MELKLPPAVVTVSRSVGPPTATSSGLGGRVCVRFDVAESHKSTSVFYGPEGEHDSRVHRASASELLSSGRKYDGYIIHRMLSACEIVHGTGEFRKVRWTT